MRWPRDGEAVQRTVKAPDLLVRQEARELRTWVPHHTPRRVRAEMAARDGVVEYPAKQFQHAIGPAGRGPAVLVEPAGDAGTSDAIQRQRAEGRQQASSQGPAPELLRRRFASVEKGTPWTRDEFPECRSCAAVVAVRLFSGLDSETLAARVLDVDQGDRPEGDPARAAFALPAIYEAPMTRRPDAYAETRMTRVPDCVKTSLNSDFRVSLLDF